MTERCISCGGIGLNELGGWRDECVDCHGKGYVDSNDEVFTRNETLADIRAWFVGEVEAGDTSLQVWVDRIDNTLGLKLPTK